MGRGKDGQHSEEKQVKEGRELQGYGRVVRRGVRVKNPSVLTLLRRWSSKLSEIKDFMVSCSVGWEQQLFGLVSCWRATLRGSIPVKAVSGWSIILGMFA